MPSTSRSLPDQASRRGGLVAAVATGALLLLVVLPPFVTEGLRAALMAGFSFVCHQMPGRSPHVDGTALAVCHRCLGIYLGLFAAGLLFPLLARADGWLWRHSRAVIVLSLVPMGLDWGGDFVGLFSNGWPSRILTGAVFGLAGGYFLARGIAGLFAPRPADPAMQPHAELHA